MTRVAWAAAIGAMLIAGAGCYHPGPYAPNYGAYPTYPGYQPVPQGTVPATPGGTYIVPPGQTVPGGTLGAPTTPYPTQQGPTMAPPLDGGGMNGGGGGNAPPATFAPDSGGGGAVPNYEDPSTSDFGTTPPDGFQPPEEPFMEGGTAVPQPNNFASAAPAGGTPNYFADLSEYGENPPSTGVQPAGYEEPAGAAGARPGPLGGAAGANSGSQKSWYGYDREGYRWLRGVVNYDPQSQEWFIMYGLPPEEGERYGGALTLTKHPAFKDFKNNDVVEVRGYIDPSAGTDLQGKPYYHVEEATLMGQYK